MTRLPNHMQRYLSEKDDCPCSINGQTCSPLQLKVRTMNFGQHWRTPGITEVNYEVILPKAFALGYLKKELPEYVGDAKQFPDFEDPLENILRERRWPEVHAILEDPALASLVIQWYGHDLLLRWFGDGSPKQLPGFVINTIESVSIKNGNPCFWGKARAMDRPVKYQDD